MVKLDKIKKIYKEITVSDKDETDEKLKSGVDATDFLRKLCTFPIFILGITYMIFPIIFLLVGILALIAFVLSLRIRKLEILLELKNREIKLIKKEEN